MIVECYRGAGDLPGEQVQAPLLSDAALIERGRAELDARAQRVDAVALSILPRPALALGSLIAYADPVSGRLRQGKVTGQRISVSAAGPVIEHSLSVEVLA